MGPSLLVYSQAAITAAKAAATAAAAVAVTAAVVAVAVVIAAMAVVAVALVAVAVVVQQRHRHCWTIATTLNSRVVRNAHVCSTRPGCGEAWGLQSKRAF